MVQFKKAKANVAAARDNTPPSPRPRCMLGQPPQHHRRPQTHSDCMASVTTPLRDRINAHTASPPPGSVCGTARVDKRCSDAHEVKQENSEGPGPTPPLQQNNTSVQILIEGFRTKQAHSCCLWCGKCHGAAGIFDSTSRQIEQREPGKHAQGWIQNSESL